MEERYTIKNIEELKKAISLRGRIKITGRRIVRLSKVMLHKIKTWYKRNKDKLYDYTIDVAEEERDRLNSKIDNKLENLNEKISETQAIYDEYKSDVAFQKEGSIENTYLNALGEEIKYLNSKRAKLNTKSIKVSSKSFGLFKTSRLALNKFAKAKWNVIQEKIDARKKAKEVEKQQKLDAEKEASKLNDYNEIKRKYEALQEEAENFEKKHGIGFEDFVKGLDQDTQEQETNMSVENQEDTIAIDNPQAAVEMQDSQKTEINMSEEQPEEKIEGYVPYSEKGISLNTPEAPHQVGPTEDQRANQQNSAESVIIPNNYSFDNKGENRPKVEDEFNQEVPATNMYDFWHSQNQDSQNQHKGR